MVGKRKMSLQGVGMTFQYAEILAIPLVEKCEVVVNGYLCVTVSRTP